MTTATMRSRRSSFVNGILGSFVRNECPPEPVGSASGGAARTRRNMRALGID